MANGILDVNLSKLELTGYEVDAKGKLKGKVDNMKVYLNPETYTVSYNTAGGKGERKGDRKKNGSTGKAKALAGGKLQATKVVQFQQSISFKLFFDHTGAIPKSRDVAADLKQLKNILVNYNGEIHSTNYVKLVWGQLTFVGQVTSMSIDYQLFDLEANPLRAVVSLGFSELLDSTTKAQIENSKSPDLTHMRTVQMGDNLPLMCYQVYGDPSYYLEVAKANQLTNFMQLEPGQRLIFPPIQK